MTLFVDTNFFLQCKKYDQLPWQNLSDQKNITILISSPVLKEIDRLKNDGNSRRAKRARETTTLFKTVFNSSDFLQRITIKDIELTLSFAKNYVQDELAQVAEGLDMNNPDDQILACVKNYIRNSENDYQNCFFVSNDTNPLITASRNNIPAIEIPDDWLLPPENDERDKEIIALKRQLHEFQNNIPQFSLDFSIQNEKLINKNNNANEYTVLIGSYKTLDDSEVDELVQEFLKKHPLQTDFERNLTSLDRAIHPLEKYYPPSEETTKRYKDLYNKWTTDIRNMISEYADIHNKIADMIPFRLFISNIGNVPAKELFVDFAVLSGGLLVCPDFQEDLDHLERKAYPTPPKPPGGRWKSIFHSSFSAIAATNAFSHFSDYPPVLPKILLPEKHDRYGFYWKGGKPKENVNTWRFECDEFRHKTDPEEFIYSLLFEQNSDKLVFCVFISASNLSNPVEKKYILHKKSQQIDTKTEILHLLRHGVTEEIMRKIEGKGKMEYDK
jgi:hypothetical protein